MTLGLEEWKDKQFCFVPSDGEVLGGLLGGAVQQAFLVYLGEKLRRSSSIGLQPFISHVN